MNAAAAQGETSSWLAYSRSFPRPPHDLVIPGSHATYRIVLDLSDAGARDDKVHPGLEAVLALIRQYEAYGVAAARRRLALVIHGDDVGMTLADASYKKRYGGRRNGDGAALRNLMQQGVLLIVSKESLDRREIHPEELASGIRIAPTANMAFIDFENDGFVYSSTKSLDAE